MGDGGGVVNRSKQDYVTLPLAEVVTRLRSVILRECRTYIFSRAFSEIRVKSTSLQKI